MASFSFKAPDNQPVKFIELFLDVIYVFSIVQIVELLHGHFDFITVLEAILIFWLVWWSWTQFTWVLNATDTENDFVEVIILIVTAISFFMAIAIPEAFGVDGFKFAVAYILSRIIGLALFTLVARSHDKMTMAAVISITVFSLSGLGAVLLGSLLGGIYQYILWTLVIILDIIVVKFPRERMGFFLQPEHFAERHGLFMIIVLGETLLINANGLLDATDDTNILKLAISAVFVTLALWWSYFAHNKEKLEEVMIELGDENDSFTGRDIYSLGHFPIIFGVITYASALEDVISHPLDPVSASTKIAFAIGIFLFTVGIAVVIRKATGELLKSRIYIAVIIASIILFMPNISPVAILSSIFIGLLLIGIIEERAVED